MMRGAWQRIDLHRDLHRGAAGVSVCKSATLLLVLLAI